MPTTSNQHALVIDVRHVHRKKIRAGYTVHIAHVSPQQNIQLYLCGRRINPGWRALAFNFIINNDPNVCPECRENYAPVSNTGVNYA